MKAIIEPGCNVFGSVNKIYSSNRLPLKINIRNKVFKLQSFIGYEFFRFTKDYVAGGYFSICYRPSMNELVWRECDHHGLFGTYKALSIKPISLLIYVHQS